MRSTRGALRQGLGLTIAAVTLVLVASIQLDAAPQRGRLSKDLRAGYDAGRATFDVIVQADRGAIDEAVARYGVRIKKSLKTGAVVEASREALEAMSQDGRLGQLA